MECVHGYKEMLRYLAYQRPNIVDRAPIMGIEGVNHEGDGTDMYYKGAWMLHSIRSAMGNDSLFKAMIKGIATHFKHQTVTTTDIVSYCNRFSGMDLTPIFDHYLKKVGVPNFVYSVNGKELTYRWDGVDKSFKMPVDIEVKGKLVHLTPTTTDQTYTSAKPLKKMKVRTDLYLIEATRK